MEVNGFKAVGRPVTAIARGAGRGRRREARVRGRTRAEESEGGTADGSGEEARCMERCVRTVTAEGRSVMAVGRGAKGGESGRGRRGGGGGHTGAEERAGGGPGDL